MNYSAEILPSTWFQTASEKPREQTAVEVIPESLFGEWTPKENCFFHSLMEKEEIEKAFEI